MPSAEKRSTSPADKAGQAADSVERNREFFSRDTYGNHADALDSHERIRHTLTGVLRGSGRLLDVGNGGVFEYDLDVADEIVGVDLFLGEEASKDLPSHVKLRHGDALDLDEEAESYDVVLQAFLFHHLAGRRAADSIANTSAALAEAVRVLRPGGRLVIAESCVPRSFYALERIMYQPLRALASTPLTGGHPATLQLPIDMLLGLVEEQLTLERHEPIELGRWITQFGRRFPTALTPVRAHLITATKPG